MSTLYPPPPTPHQIFTLTHITPPIPNKPPPDVHPLLSDLHSIIISSGVSSFLFTEDPIHVPYLTQPRSPYMRNISLTRVSPLQAPLPLHESCNLRANMLYLPVFTMSTLTLGFGVMNASAVSNRASHDLYQNSPLILNFRFAYDSAAAFMLEVFDVPNSNFITINFSKFHSPKRTSSSKAYFLRTHLKEYLRLQPFDVNALSSSLVMITSECQERACPICLTDSCTCNAVPNLPRHPFDFTPFTQAMEFWGGHFQNVADKMRFHNRRLAQHIALGSATIVSSFSNLDTVKMLCSWALRDHASRTTQRPLMIAGPVEQNLDPVVEESVRADSWRGGNVSACGSSLLSGATCGADWWDEKGELSPGKNVKMTSVAPLGGEDDGKGDDDDWPHLDGGMLQNDSEQLGDEYLVSLMNGSVGVDIDGREEKMPVGKLLEVEKSEKWLKKEIKKEIRRAKNRRAAQISNEQKRQRIIRLRSNLEKEREREAELRDQERMLRREKIRLKSLAEAQGLLQMSGE